MKDTGTETMTAATGTIMDVDEFLALVQYSIQDPTTAATILDHVGIYPGLLRDEDRLADGYGRLISEGIMEMDYTAMVPGFAKPGPTSPETLFSSILLAQLLSETESFIFIRVMLGKAVNSMTLLSDGNRWALLWMSSRRGSVSMSSGFSRENMADTVWSKISRACAKSTPTNRFGLNIIRVGGDRGIRSATSMSGSVPEFDEPKTDDPVLAQHAGIEPFTGLYMYPSMAAFKRRVEFVTEVI